MSILLTGATGFIGNNVLKRLLQIYSCDDIIALSSKQLNTKTILHNSYNFEANYLLENGCSDVEIIIHIGAFTPKDMNEANDVKNCSSNINSTQVLLNSNLPKLKKIIYVSTLDVYQDTNEIINEKTAINPVSLYGLSKLYCEKIVEISADKRKVDFQILRLGHVFGQGEEKYKKILPITINKVLQGQKIEIWGDGEAIRTYIYIDDVVNSIVNSIDRKCPKIINVVGEERITINELVKKIIEISGKNIQVRHIKTNVPNRNLVFDNKLLKDNLVEKLTKFEIGLMKEYRYMEQLQ